MGEQPDNQPEDARDNPMFTGCLFADGFPISKFLLGNSTGLVRFDLSSSKAVRDF